jgi:hypothetical protein
MAGFVAIAVGQMSNDAPKTASSRANGMFNLLKRSHPTMRHVTGQFSCVFLPSRRMRDEQKRGALKLVRSPTMWQLENRAGPDVS